MMGRGVVYLQAQEIVRKRSFTHPDRITHDYNILRSMLIQICLLLESPNPVPHTVFLTEAESGRWFHRLVLPRSELLRRPQPLAVVGFFGERRENADLDLAQEFDRTLIAEIDDHPGLLSYSSMAVANGNYGNLVLFASRRARDHWRSSQAHAQAANMLAPGFYTSVRIYNGRLPGGIENSHGLQLTRAKYYDYGSDPLWQAVREFE